MKLWHREEAGELQELPNVAPDADLATKESEASECVDEAGESDEVGELLRSLKRQSRRHRWFSSMATTLMGIFAFYVPMGVGIYIVTSPLHASALELTFGVTPLLLLLGIALLARMAKRERVKLTATVAQYDDARAVGPLAEALLLNDKALRRQASAALSRILPTLRPEDAHLLSTRHRMVLAMCLIMTRWPLRGSSPELSLAILSAYHAIGDGTEVPAVRRLVEGGRRGPVDPRIREAALAYLAEAQRRSEQQRLKDTLLRPSAPPDAAEVLLRPARGVGEPDPDLLLRPADPGA